MHFNLQFVIFSFVYLFVNVINVTVYHYFQVDPANVRPIREGAVDALLEAEKEAEATRQALKRKIAKAAAADSDFHSRSLPVKLRIEPADLEDVVHFTYIFLSFLTGIYIHVFFFFKQSNHLFSAWYLSNEIIRWYNDDHPHLCWGVGKFGCQI